MQLGGRARHAAARDPAREHETPTVLSREQRRTHYHCRHRRRRHRRRCRVRRCHCRRRRLYRYASA